MRLSLTLDESVLLASMELVGASSILLSATFLLSVSVLDPCLVTSTVSVTSKTLVLGMS